MTIDKREATWPGNRWRSRAKWLHRGGPLMIDPIPPYVPPTGIDPCSIPADFIAFSQSADGGTYDGEAFTTWGYTNLSLPRIVRVGPERYLLIGWLVYENTHPTYPRGENIFGQLFDFVPDLVGDGGTFTMHDVELLVENTTRTKGIQLNAVSLYDPISGEGENRAFIVYRHLIETANGVWSTKNLEAQLLDCANPTVGSVIIPREVDTQIVDAGLGHEDSLTGNEAGVRLSSTAAVFPVSWPYDVLVDPVHYHLVLQDQGTTFDYWYRSAYTFSTPGSGATSTLRDLSQLWLHRITDSAYVWFAQYFVAPASSALTHARLDIGVWTLEPESSPTFPDGTGGRIASALQLGAMQMIAQASPTEYLALEAGDDSQVCGFYVNPAIIDWLETRAAGAQLHMDAGAPAGGLGVDGDAYLDTTTTSAIDLYLKAGGSWDAGTAIGAGVDVYPDIEIATGVGGDAINCQVAGGVNATFQGLREDGAILLEYHETTATDPAFDRNGDAMATGIFNFNFGLFTFDGTTGALVLEKGIQAFDNPEILRGTAPGPGDPPPEPDEEWDDSTTVFMSTVAECLWTFGVYNMWHSFSDSATDGWRVQRFLIKDV